MKTVTFFSEYPSQIINDRLDIIASRIPCIAKYNSKNKEITITCRIEDVIFVERMLKIWFNTKSYCNWM